MVLAQPLRVLGTRARTDIYACKTPHETSLLISFRVEISGQEGAYNASFCRLEAAQVDRIS